MKNKQPSISLPTRRGDDYIIMGDDYIIMSDDDI